ncbi:hypothetical protein ABC195_03535 [Microbacterium sp. 2P01SA-2]|uniref:hypothetical protein n=1 Tax=unclassified Microbacterium TaxID=2609290 RepID=UPI0039A236B8
MSETRPRSRWLPEEPGKRLVLAIGGLAGALFVTIVGALIGVFGDDIKAATDDIFATSPTSGQPVQIQVAASGMSAERLYAVAEADMQSATIVGEIVSGVRPAAAVPIGRRFDSWSLRTTGSEPITILSITAVDVTATPAHNEVFVDFGMGGEGGGDEVPEVHDLTLDLASGAFTSPDGQPHFRSQVVTVRSDVSTVLNMGTVVPDGNAYTWLLRIDLETADGEQSHLYAGASGDLYADKTAVPRGDVFEVTARSDDYQRRYLPDGSGTLQLAPAAGSSAQHPLGTPPDLAGRWCPRTANDACIDTAAIVAEYPQATMATITGGDVAGATDYRVCFRVDADGACPMADAMFLRYFPVGVGWDCGDHALWLGRCDPDFSADHDLSQERLVRLLNHQQGDAYVDTAPAYRDGAAGA